jgi:uncharacterized protein
MTSQAQALYQLQTIDLQLLQHQQRMNALDAALKENQAVREAQVALEQATAKLHPLRTKIKNLELEVQSNRGKAELTEQTLYGGKVKNTKEMQDMQHEIAALGKRHRELEDQLLTVMMEIEESEAAQQAAESQLAHAQQTHAAQQDQLQLERGQVQVQIDKLQRDRAAALANVTAENQKRYATMRPRKANQPIALLRNNACDVCGVEQETSIVQAVRKNQELVTCSNCERILAALF